MRLCSMRNRNGQISKLVRVDCKFSPASQHLRDWPLRGRVGVRKFLKNKSLHDKNCLIKSCNWSHRPDKIEQVLCTIQVLCFTYKKSCTSYCPTKKLFKSYKDERKNHTPKKLPYTLPFRSKNNGPSHNISQHLSFSLSIAIADPSSIPHNAVN